MSPDIKITTLHPTAHTPPNHKQMPPKHHHQTERLKMAEGWCTPTKNDKKGLGIELVGRPSCILQANFFFGLKFSIPKLSPPPRPGSACVSACICALFKCLLHVFCSHVLVKFLPNIFNPCKTWCCAWLRMKMLTGNFFWSSKPVIHMCFLWKLIVFLFFSNKMTVATNATNSPVSNKFLFPFWRKWNQVDLWSVMAFKIMSSMVRFIWGVGGTPAFMLQLSGKLSLVDSRSLSYRSKWPGTMARLMAIWQ